MGQSHSLRLWIFHGLQITGRKCVSAMKKTFINNKDLFERYQNLKRDCYVIDNYDKK